MSLVGIANKISNDIISIDDAIILETFLYLIVTYHGHHQYMTHKQHVMESSYKCEQCGKSFHNRRELHDHIYLMHGI